MRLLGIDYGGSFTKLLLVDGDGPRREALRQETVPTPAGPTGLDDLGRIAAAFAGPEGVAAFGVTVAGLLNADGRTVGVSTNMPWLVGRDPVAVLSAATRAPGAVLNDGEAAATAEAVLGAGRQWDDVFMLALGTGIAGAHVVDGVVRRGAHGAAGEVGHIATGEGRLCSCGQRGCLEVALGGRSLALRWAEESGRPAGTSAKAVVDAAAAGDPIALRLLDEATTGLARSILGIVSLIDPAAIVIGGGLSNARDRVLEPAIAKARRAATFHQVPPIVAAELGAFAGAWGAVLAAEGAVAAEPEPTELPADMEIATYIQ